MWQGQAWWFLLPDELSIQEPQNVAELLLENDEIAPQQLARWLGCQRFYPLDEARLAKWSHQARKGLIAREDIPDPLLLLSIRQHFPEDCPPEIEATAARVWKHLSTVLGQDRTSNLLAYMLLPWREWQEREEFHKRRFKALSDFFQKNPKFAQDWEDWKPHRKAVFFSQWMDRGRISIEELARVDIQGSPSQIIRRMRDLWCGQVNKPTARDTLQYLALGLMCIDIFVPDLLPITAVQEILEFQDPLTPQQLKMLMKWVPFHNVNIHSLAEAQITESELEYVVKKELFWVLQQEATPPTIAQYLIYHKRLKQAGFKSVEIEFEMLLERADEPHIFAYLVFNNLERKAQQSMLEALNDIAPKGRFLDFQSELPPVPPPYNKEIPALAELFGSTVDSLEKMVAQRLALGFHGLPKRLVRWSASHQEQEREHLKQLLSAEPNNRILEARLENLAQWKLHPKEKLRCQREVESQLSELPERLWKQQRLEISDRLLREILGPSLFEEVPRAALFLKHSEVPVSRLVELRQDHPANTKWLQRFETYGFSAAHWLGGWQADLRIGDKFVEFRTETDPAEILEMGTHFKTCLSLEGEDGFNAFSVLTNLLEVNKMVMIGRGTDGKVMVRKLLGLTQTGHLVGYQTYSHLQGAKAPVHAACRRFAERFGFTLSDDATPERILKDLDWYDDGPETWLTPSQPLQLPPHWPSDQNGIRQWKTQKLITEQLSFKPRRSVEFFHHLQQGIVPPKVTDPTTTMWQSAIDKLIFLGRYDLVSVPQFVGDPTSLPASLWYHGSIRRSDADACVALFNPEHRLYRNCDFTGKDLSYFGAPSCAALCAPKILQETLAGLNRQGYLTGFSRLRNDFVELTRINFHLQPADRGWLKFDEDELGDFMAEVASLLKIPPWEAALRRYSQKHPGHENTWLARARIEGDKILTELRELLSRNRRSLKFALSLSIAGETPQNYILPRPDILFSQDYLHQARPLATLIKPRLKRLQSKGYSQRKIHQAYLFLKESEPVEWRHWGSFTCDSDLDAKLTAMVVKGELAQPGPWLKLGDVALRADVLRLLQVDLDPDMKKSFLDLLNLGYPEASRRLTRLWLNPSFNDDGACELDESLFLSREWPDILDSYLGCLDLEDSLDILEHGAEYLQPGELKALLARIWSDTLFDPDDVENLLTDQEVCVELQLEIIQRLRAPLGESLTKTERGRWAKFHSDNKFAES